MKTSVEINGYLITIEEIDGVISVNAAKDDEIVEEFTITVEEGEEGEEGEDVRPFGEYGEEDDFDSDDDDDDVQDEMQDEMQDELQDEDEDDDDELQGRALESFQSFISKKK
jgi:hypothetical protein